MRQLRRLSETPVGAGAREARTQAGAPDAERLALLVDASRQLAGAGLEPPAVLERLCQLVMPRLCTSCHVRLLSADGRWLESAASAHTGEWSPELMERVVLGPADWNAVDALQRWTPPADPHIAVSVHVAGEEEHA